MTNPTDAWGDWPEGGDPIGTASARLLALGVERRARLATLRFLGLLLDHADDAGRVRYDPEALAAEFLIRREDARLFLRWLDDASVVEREGRELVVHGAAGRAGRPAEGLREGVAMAVIGDVLGHNDIDLDAPPEAAPEPEPLPALPHAEPEKPAEVPTARVGQRRRPVMAGAAVLAGLVLVAAGIVSGPSRSPDTTEIAAGSTESSAEATDTGTSGSPDSSIVGPSAPSSAPSASAEEGTGAEDATDATGELPAGGQTEPTSPSDTLLDTGELADPVTCPAAAPAVRGVEAVVVPAGEEVVGVGVTVPTWQVVVRGEVVGGDAGATIESIIVRIEIAGADVHEVEALTSAISVPAAGDETWEVSLDPTTSTIDSVSATAELAEWRWSDDDLAAACA